MTRIKLDYVHAYADRHGKVRYYFRRKGFKRVSLPGKPGSAEFMSAYQLALGTAPRTEIGARRSKVGSVSAAVAGYFGSMEFGNLAESSQGSRRRILERFRAEHGDKRIAQLERRHIVTMLDAKAKKPGSATNFLAAIRALMRYAINVGLRSDNPTVGLRGPRLREGGHYAWTEDDIARFEQHHPIGSKARLALALLLYSGQRRADTIRLGRQHVRDGLIHLRQAKTGKALAIPVHPALQAVLDATPPENMTFLVAQGGHPFSPDGFTHWFKKRCKEAGVTAEASPHGLRKAACRRLAEAGCSASVIAAISGHRSLREVQRYVEGADQIRLARQGIEAVSRTRSG
jgi:integrase